MFLEFANTAFNSVAPPVGLGVEVQGSSPMLAQLVAALGDHGLNCMVSQPGSNSGHAVGFVAGEPLWAAQRSALRTTEPSLVHEDFEAGGFMLLTSGEIGGQGNALAVGQHMELGAKPASGAP